MTERRVVIDIENPDCLLEDVDSACELATEMLLEAELYDGNRRLVPAMDLLRVVQRLNAACEHFNAQTFKSEGES